MRYLLCNSDQQLGIAGHNGIGIIAYSEGDSDDDFSVRKQKTSLQDFTGQVIIISANCTAAHAQGMKF